MLLKYTDRSLSVEALLFGCAGFLDAAEREDDYVRVLKQEWEYLCRKHKMIEMSAAQWKFMRIRPNAFPSIRLAMLAAFVMRFRNCAAEILDVTSLSEVEDMLDVTTSSYWDWHYKLGYGSSVMTKRIGLQMKQTIIINAVIPFLFVYGKECGEEKYVERAIRWLESLHPESNHITKEWEGCGVVFGSALQTQAIIQLRREYCEKHLCLRCKIGREVLKTSL